MNKIKSLQLENFMGFKNETIEFTNGLNVISPFNTSRPEKAHGIGKTTIIRALEAILLNRTANGFIRTGEKEFHVTLEFEDGQTIERIRSNSINQYKFNGEVLDSPGKTVPEQVYSISGILPVPTGKGEEECIQIAKRNEKFLVDFSGPATAALLSSLSGADKIRTALKSVNKDSKTIKSDIQTKEEQLATAETKVKTLAWTVKAKEKLKNIKEKQKQLEAIDSWIAAINELLSIEEKIAHKKAVLAKCKEYRESIDKKLVILETIDEEFTIINNLLREATNIKNAIEIKTEELKNKKEERELLEKKMKTALEEAGQCYVCGATKKKGWQI